MLLTPEKSAAGGNAPRSAAGKGMEL